MILCGENVPFAPHVMQSLENALADCFQYHNQLDSMLTRAGVLDTALAAARTRASDRSKAKGKYEKAPKRYVVQEVLSHLSKRGGDEEDRAIASLITSLCQGTFPESSASAREAIKELQRYGAQDKHEKEEARRAKQREEQAERAQQEDKDLQRMLAERAKTRDSLLQRFMALITETNHQKRGYQLEALLNDLFQFEGLDPRSSFRIIGEQIDGSFAWDGDTHLIEAKWQSEPVAGDAFAGLIYKTEGKSIKTHGLFISINGYSQEALAGLEKKGELRIVCIDGAHIIRCLQPGGSIKKFLQHAWRHASETGKSYFPVSEIKD